MSGKNQVKAFINLLGDLHTVISGQTLIQNGEVKRFVQGISGSGGQGNVQDLPFNVFKDIVAALTGKVYIGRYDPGIGRVQKDDAHCHPWNHQRRKDQKNS